jgi:hypothetical protein
MACGIIVLSLSPPKVSSAKSKFKFDAVGMKSENRRWMERLGDLVFGFDLIAVIVSSLLELLMGL